MSPSSRVDQLHMFSKVDEKMLEEVYFFAKYDL